MYISASLPREVGGLLAEQSVSGLGGVELSFPPYADSSLPPTLGYYGHDFDKMWKMHSLNIFLCCSDTPCLEQFRT